MFSLKISSQVALEEIHLTYTETNTETRKNSSQCDRFSCNEEITGLYLTPLPLTHHAHNLYVMQLFKDRSL